jgi:hypothetical protein
MDDHTSGARAHASFGAMGATKFYGTEGSEPPASYFSGWMTEWRHAKPYFGPTAAATYTLEPRQTLGYRGVDEWVPGPNTILFNHGNLTSLSTSLGSAFVFENVTETTSESLFVTG